MYVYNIFIFAMAKGVLEAYYTQFSMCKARHPHEGLYTFETPQYE
jgi:hypothetical protein